MHPIENPNNPNNLIEQVEVKDVVSITTKSGNKYRFKVRSVTEDKISSKNVEIAVSDISEISVRRTDQEKVNNIRTWVTFGGIIVLVYLLVGTFQIIDRNDFGLSF